MEYSLCTPPISRGITDDPGGALGSTPASSSSSLVSASSSNETSPELTDDATSEGPGRIPRREPYEMSSLMAGLPFKRGLSRHYHGKSQSFTSLAKVGSLEDLAKPEKTTRPCKKKPKPCKKTTYAAGPEKENPIGPARSPVSGYSKAISRRGSRGGVPALLARPRRPPVAPPPHGHRSGGFPTQASTLLFA